MHWSTFNKWYDEGHVIYSSLPREPKRTANIPKDLARKNTDSNTMAWSFGKPRGGNYHWIDNHLVKATRYRGKFTDLVEKEVTIQVFDDGKHE
jgi:hypothetical protein